MPIVTTPPPEQAANYWFVYEPNAVGRAASDLRNQEQDDLRGLAATSIFWQRVLLLGIARQKLLELSHLRSNWDSYGAPSPNEDAIENAARILELMQPSDLEKVKIMASGEGGIGLCFKIKDRYADLETSNDGAILGVRYAGMETPVLIDVDGTEDSIKAALEQIRNHIGS